MKGGRGMLTLHSFSIKNASFANETSPYPLHKGDFTNDTKSVSHHDLPIQSPSSIYS